MFGLLATHRHNQLQMKVNWINNKKREPLLTRVTFFIVVEVRHVVGRLIWECEGEQSAVKVNKPGKCTQVTSCSLNHSVGLPLVLQGFRQRFSMHTENEHREVSKSEYVDIPQ